MITIKFNLPLVRLASFLRSAALRGLVIALCCAGAPSVFAWSTKMTFAASALFDHNGAELDSTGQAALLQLATRLDEGGKLEAVVVVGHADRAEREPQALSERRAASVRLYLMQLGVSPQQIYEEGHAANQPLEGQSGAFQRRVEIDSVGTHIDAADTQGFRLLWQWHNKSSTAVTSNPEQVAGEWRAMTPLQLLPSIVDPTLRERFVHKYEMVAIRSQDDKLLQMLLKLEAPGKSDPGMISPAIVAAAFGSELALTAFAPALQRLDVRDTASRQYALRLWCGTRLERKPLIDHVAMLRMKVPQMFANLPVDETVRWVTCGADRAAAADAAMDLRFLKLNQIDLDARDSAGRTALQLCVRAAQLDCINALLDQGVNVNARDKDGRTALHAVGDAAHSAFLGPSVSNTERRALWDALVANGASPSIPDHKGNLPFVSLR